MNIIFDESIANKYMKGYSRQISSITDIVIHGTGGGESAKSLLNWMLTLNGETSEDKKKKEERYKKGIGLYHYLIDINGDIYNIIDPKNGVYHSDCGEFDLLHTIGIELLNTEEKNRGEYTEDQYTALFQLISYLREIFFMIINIGSHDYYRHIFSGLAKKPCPGMTFNWSLVEKNVPGLWIKN